MAVLNCTPKLFQNKNFTLVLCFHFQLLLLLLFILFVRYEDKEGDFKLSVYPMFQDVHVMIFIGFGFLMTFLKRYGFSAVGFNFLLAAIIVQWAIICQGFFEMNANYKILISVLSLLRADVASAVVLISMGALLGNTSYVQLIVMGFIEIVVFAANSHLGTNIFKVVDAGGSIFIHAFGAYFGLAVSYVLGRKKKRGPVEQSTGTSNQMEENQLEGSSYTSDLFAMIGTVFLWIFWPSFNAAELEGDQQVRAIVNTYLTLASCCVTSFLVSSAVTENNKFDMVHIQNSTLAGGVAIGTSANLMVQPFGAVIIGINAGVLSVYGYHYLTPFLHKTLKIHDTCGIHNLHGMPAIMAGLIGALMAALATEKDYGTQLYQVFPARGSAKQPPLPPGDGRTAVQQAAYQILALVTTLIISIISGLITGLLIRNISPIDNQNAYADDIAWQIDEPHLAQLQESAADKEENVLDISCVENNHEAVVDLENPTTDKTLYM